MAHAIAHLADQYSNTMANLQVRRLIQYANTDKKWNVKSKYYYCERKTKLTLILL